MNYQRALGEFQSVLGLVVLYGGDPVAARRLLEDSFNLCLDLNDGRFLRRVCTYLAETALWVGDLAEAERWLAQSLAYRANLRLIRMDRIESLLVAARLATAQGAYPRAAALFGLADEMCSRIHYELAGPARQLADDALAKVRAALGLALFDEAFAAGQQLSLEAAFAMISASSSVTGAPLYHPDH